MSLFDVSSKGVKFPEIGATITGTVASAPVEKQATEYATGQPAFFPNGEPKMQILVDLKDTNAPRIDEFDDGNRTLYVSSFQMKKAISIAMRDAGATDIMPGGKLTVTYIGNDPGSKNPANPKKLYSAAYVPPAAAPSAFADTAPAAPTAAPATPATPPVQGYQQPAQQAPAAAQQPTVAQAPAAQAPTAQAQPTQQAPAAPAQGQDTYVVNLPASKIDAIRQLVQIGSMSLTDIATTLDVPIEDVNHIAGVF